MAKTLNKWLLASGLLSALASCLHLAVIVGGPDWYRGSGAGEGMARAAARGSILPPLVTFGIATILAIWALYAFSGAGLVGRLPLIRTALVGITSIYLLRGIALFPTLLFKPSIIDGFTFWSSIMVLGYGVTYLIGTLTAWGRLSRTQREPAGAV